MNVSELKDHLELLVAIGSLASAIITAIAVGAWRVGSWARRVVEGQRALSDAHRGMAEQFSRARQQLVALTRGVDDLKRRIEEGEKQDARLEGKIEQAQQTTVKLIAAMQQSTGSLDALWRTLHALFPDRVPKRAGDRDR